MRKISNKLSNVVEVYLTVTYILFVIFPLTLSAK
jgi:hypothetical protein